MSKQNLGKWYRIRKLKVTSNNKKLENLFFKNLKKLGFRYFNIKVRKSSDKKIITAFQQHYLPNNVTGKIDQKTFRISHFLTH